MTNRLVWNFEFTSSSKLILANLDKEKEDELKWEARFFWPENAIIKLKLLDNSLLELSHYQHKQKNDIYYLVKKNYNIKNRREVLVYKPLIKKGKYAVGFGPKLHLSADALNPEIEEVIQQLNNSKTVVVKKESFSYKFPTQPTIKLELARIEIDSVLYFTLCLEGKSRALVEKMSKHLVGKQPNEEYVSFLKRITKTS